MMMFFLNVGCLIFSTLPIKEDGRIGLKSPIYSGCPRFEISKSGILHTLSFQNGPDNLSSASRLCKTTCRHKYWAIA